MHYRARPVRSEGAGEGLGATWGSGPAAPGVGRAIEGGPEGWTERGVTTSKAGRSLWDVEGPRG